jgi:hypothetical protein
VASGDHDSAEDVPSRSATVAGAGVRHRFIQCDVAGSRREIRGSDQGSPTDARRTFSAVWAELPLEERKQLNSADDRSDRLRTTRPVVWRAYLEDFATPSVHLTFHGGDMARVRLLMKEFGMSVPGLPPPAFPDPADYGITEDVYGTVRRAHRHTDHRSADHHGPTAEERRRLAEFGAALTRVASWHAVAELDGIPEHKLTIDASVETRYCGWTIRAAECAATLRTWRSLVERYGKETLMRRVGAELETELWSGWLVHLDGAIRRDGLHVVGSLDAWSVLHKLQGISANDS